MYGLKQTTLDPVLCITTHTNLDFCIRHFTIIRFPQSWTGLRETNVKRWWENHQMIEHPDVLIVEEEITKLFSFSLKDKKIPNGINLQTSSIRKTDNFHAGSNYCFFFFLKGAATTEVNSSRRRKSLAGLTKLHPFSQRYNVYKSNQNINHSSLLWGLCTVSFNKTCKYFAVNWFPSFNSLIYIFIIHDLFTPLLEQKRKNEVWMGVEEEFCVEFTDL